MSNINDFRKHEREIKAFPDKLTEEPNMPIALFLQEIEDLLSWTIKDREDLIRVGLEEIKLTKLKELTGACRHIQIELGKEINSRSAAAIEWRIRAFGALDLRDRLLHTCRFVFRDKLELLNQVERIDENYSNADMIRDLNSLASIGKANSKLLDPIMDLYLLEEAETQSDELADLLSHVNGDKDSDTENKIMRNKTYTLLKYLVDEVRQYGVFIFWRNEARLSGYSSAYERKLKKNLKTI